MSTETDGLFADNYIAAWSTTDLTTRTELVALTYAPDAIFFANEPGDQPVELHGLAKITANISDVNKRLVQEKGLSTEKTAVSVNHDLMKVSWQMTTPDQQVVMTGSNLLHRDDSNRIVQDYIFIGSAS